MDQLKFVEVLKATLDPVQNKQANEHLEQVHKIIGFAPELLKIVMLADVPLPVRQAGAVYLKNEIGRHWPPPSEDEAKPGEPVEYSIHEQDKGLIRNSLIEAIAASPEVIRTQLAMCFHTIIRFDFPGKWPDIVDKIGVYLENPDVSFWPGTLLALYQLCKGFDRKLALRFKRGDERKPFLDGMKRLLPLLFQRCVELQAQSLNQDIVLIQKQILKIFHSLIEFSLPVAVVTIPELTRYGLPKKCSKEYNHIASWHIKTFPPTVIQVLFKFLEAHSMKIYVSQRVLQGVLNYLTIALMSPTCYKMLKPHIPSLLEKTIFPIMCFSEKDERTMKEDPIELIKQKYDVLEGLMSAELAATTFLEKGCKLRKDFLDKAMFLASKVLTDPGAAFNTKDGALHMVGAVSKTLMKKEPYKSQLEALLVANLIPAFDSPCGLLRARANWVVQRFASLPFKSDNGENLKRIVLLILRSLLSDPELPVKVESAMAIQEILSNHDEGMRLLEPQIQEIVMEILKVMRETKNDELTNVLQHIVRVYSKQLGPIVSQIINHLAQTFIELVGTKSTDDESLAYDKSDENAIAAMGIITTMDDIAEVFEEEPEIMATIEPILLNVISHIFSNSILDLYEEAFTLAGTLTTERVSEDCWKLFEMIYQVFERDGSDYFEEMMTALYHFITVNTDGFLANNDRVLALFNICKKILTSNQGEDMECHAAKLLEIILLNCKGRIDACVPVFVELALSRLMCQEIVTSELRTMCIQVVIAAILYNPVWVLGDVLLNVRLPPPSNVVPAGYALEKFIAQWMHDIDCFLGIHDRKTSILGICAMMSLDPQTRPACLSNYADAFLPSLVVLFDGIKRAYEARAAERSDEEDESGDSDTDSKGELGSDEEEEHLDATVKPVLARRKMNSDTLETDDDDDDDDSDYAPDEDFADLEMYSTVIDDDETGLDEFAIFKEVMSMMPMRDPGWYESLTSKLEKKQMESIQAVGVLADQRKAAAESKKIEKSGGYKFTQQTVPSSFNFGGPN
ncbi:unnamed protein product [Notodromas monacha]|uniref:Importin N-terminal domain-containing protein n=1 Tax=Notodromas monacha TaxID=399045 RepID=A0A7R9BQV5_9CRUS|nr:unnamed protein product [Notodromas monacha]CAG0918650.1 unnamed protein product [Notodromas monacha]